MKKVLLSPILFAVVAACATAIYCRAYIKPKPPAALSEDILKQAFQQRDNAIAVLLNRIKNIERYIVTEHRKKVQNGLQERKEERQIEEN